MRSSYQKILILLIALAAIAWTAWQKLEWSNEKQWVAAAAEVNKRPMLAAGLFLESQGFSVSRVINQRSFDRIPDEVGTLFVCEGKLQLSEAHYTELERWMSHGGHLVINSAGGGQLLEEDDASDRTVFDLRSKPVAELYLAQGVSVGNEAASQDCWHQAVDFEPKTDDDNADTELQEAMDVVSNNLANEAQSENHVPVTFTGALPGVGISRSTVVEFEGGNWLQHQAPYKARWRWQTDRGTQLLSSLYGQGRLTVMSDFSPFFNASIGTYDNAFALQQIVAAGSASNRPLLWFHERELAFPSLASVLWHKAPWAVISSLLLLSTAFWSFFGRRYEPTGDTHSSVSQLSRQLYAVGAYRWRVGNMAQISHSLLSNNKKLEAHHNRKSSAPPEQAGIHRSKTELIQQAQAHWQAANHQRGNNEHG